VLFFYGEKATGQKPHHSKLFQIAYHFVLPWVFVYTLQMVKCVKLNVLSTKQLPMYCFPVIEGWNYDSQCAVKSAEFETILRSSRQRTPRCRLI